MLSTFNAGDNLTVEIRDDTEFDHDEADIITMISYINEAAVIRILSDDTDVSVLLV